MAKPKSVWGIDIGQVALKAVKLRNVESELQVEAFDIIEHAKILSEPDADRRQLIRSALEQFLARNNVSDCQIAVAVPGQSSFTRFVKLPPVESKKIPDIVRYEAEQQIPFPITEVIWRWQTFIDPDSPDMEVGIFAMKRIDVREMLDRLTDVGIQADYVQMAPLALYNFMSFDGQVGSDGATLLADVGADKTDLVVADGPRIWTRTIQIGGNNFTEALVRAFKLSFPKAEKLKRTATTSKYAKQVFQAMRPVFADLVQEIQRSIGYYTALHRDTRFKKIVGLGNGFRLPGLQKFLEQNLNITVVPVDSYNKLTTAPSVSAPQFAENVLSLAVAYGLAVQGLQPVTVQTNLLPQEIATQRLWAKKRLWFAGSAAALLIALAMPGYNDHRIQNTLNLESNQVALKQATEKVDEQKKNRSQRDALTNQIKQYQGEIAKYLDLYKYRMFWPSLQSMIWTSLSSPSVAPDQHLIQDYINAPDQTKRNAAVEAIKKIKRSDRQVFLIDRMVVEFYPNFADIDLSDAAPISGASTPNPQAAVHPGFKVTVIGHTPLTDQGRVNEKLFQGVQRISIEQAAQSKQFEIKQFVVSKIEKVVPPVPGGAAAPGPLGAQTPGGPGLGGPVGPVLADPLLSQEDASNDTQFTIRWKIVLTEDAPAKKGSPN